MRTIQEIVGDSDEVITGDRSIEDLFVTTYGDEERPSLAETRPEISIGRLEENLDRGICDPSALER